MRVRLYVDKSNNNNTTNNSEPSPPMNYRDVFSFLKGSSPKYGQAGVAIKDKNTGLYAVVNSNSYFSSDYFEAKLKLETLLNSIGYVNLVLHNDPNKGRW